MLLLLTLLIFSAEPGMEKTWSMALLALNWAEGSGEKNTTSSKQLRFFKMRLYCYIVGLGPNCKFIDLLVKRSVLIFIKISSFIVSLFQKLFTVRQTHSQKN